MALLKVVRREADIWRVMSHLDFAADDDPTGEVDPVLLCGLTWWELALHAVSKVAVVFALALALILILGHQIGHPV